MPPPARRPTTTDSRLTADRHVPGAFEGETITRRRLVTAGANAAGAVAAAAIVVPALGFALGPVGMRAKVTWQPIGPPDALSEHTFVARTITFAPELGSIGKTTVYARRRNRRLDTEPDDRWNQFIVLTSRCSHVGCPVGFYDAAGSFICPCHGGVYDLRGRRTGGPPPRPLDRFYTRVRRGQVEVGPRYSVDSALRRFSPRDPGEPLDGIGKYLYPPRPNDGAGAPLTPSRARRHPVPFQRRAAPGPGRGRREGLGSIRLRTFTSWARCAGGEDRSRVRAAEIVTLTRPNSCCSPAVLARRRTLRDVQRQPHHEEEGRGMPWQFEVYRDSAGRYRWRLKASNGRTVASSGESFAAQSNAVHAAENVKANDGSAGGP